MLFKTTQEVALLAGSGFQLNFPTLSPSLDAAELRYLIPAIGTALYQRINDAYQLPTPAWEAGEKDLLLRMQKVVAPLAMALHIARVDVAITDSGVTRKEGTTDKTAYKYQLQNARAAFYEAGFVALESLVSFLEANAAAWPEWQDSPTRARYNELFIRSGSEFAQYYRLRRPALDFMALAPVLQTAEKVYLRSAIGAHSAQLKAKQLAGALSAAEKEICENLKSYLAYKTIATAIPQLQLKLDDSGLTFSGFGDNTTDENSKAIHGSIDAVKMLAGSTAELANEYLQMVLAGIADLDPDFRKPAVSFSSINNNGSFTL